MTQWIPPGDRMSICPRDIRQGDFIERWRYHRGVHHKKWLAVKNVRKERTPGRPLQYVVEFANPGLYDPRATFNPQIPVTVIRPNWERMMEVNNR